jgi:prepilin-type N-terminal cleavage/methylation domain-containing protein
MPLNFIPYYLNLGIQFAFYKEWCHNDKMLIYGYNPGGFMKKGFSLIELLAVITIIGVMMLLSIPAFSSIQRRARSRAAAQEIAQDLRLTRERALARCRDYRVTFDLANATYTILYIDSLGQPHSAGQKLGGPTGGAIRYGLASGATGNPPPPENWQPAPGNGGIDFPGDVLIFDNRGGSNRGVIYITDVHESYAVGINSIGKVKVYRWGNGAWF